MSVFEKFEKKYGLPGQCEKVSEKQINRFEGKLPDKLLEEWKEAGLCSYGEGFLWTVNPEDYSDILEDWVENPTESYAFLRTAFGSIFFWDGSNNYLLNVLDKTISRFNDQIENIFDATLCNEEYLDKSLLRPMFKEALAKLGPLEKDECYGVLPPPAMGGAIIIEYVEKVKIREYMAILAQV